MKKIIRLAALLLLTSCAGMYRDCSSCSASNFGSDWVIVQYNALGLPINCWRLTDAPVENEHATDGIYWQDTKTRHLVHISGWYSRVQVFGGEFDTAALQLGIDINKCKNGAYLTEQ